MGSMTLHRRCPRIGYFFSLWSPGGSRARRRSSPSPGDRHRDTESARPNAAVRNAWLSPDPTSQARAAGGLVATGAILRPLGDFGADELPDAHPAVYLGSPLRSRRVCRCVPALQRRAVTQWRCRTRRTAVAHGPNRKPAGSTHPCAPRPDRRTLRSHQPEECP
jgi:hypothetical protein